MDLIFEAIGIVIHLFIGACFGIVWPANSPQWAQVQKLGFALSLIFVAGFAMVWFLEGGELWEEIEGPVFIVSCLALLGYLLVGNACRKFHEQQ